MSQIVDLKSDCCYSNCIINPCQAEYITVAMPSSNLQPVRLLGCWNKFTYWMANSADPDQLASEEANDLDLHCLQRQGLSGFSRTRVKVYALFAIPPALFRHVMRLLYPQLWNSCVGILLFPLFFCPFVHHVKVLLMSTYRRKSGENFPSIIICYYTLAGPLILTTYFHRKKTRKL